MPLEDYSAPFSSEDTNTFERFPEVTPEQKMALRKLYGRLEERPSFHDWINSDKVQIPLVIDCIMVNAWGMWLGIETDGYTHS
jgi:hypothetical protein